jgi:hypothetical protein
MRSQCDQIGQTEQSPVDPLPPEAVWNTADGGPIFTSARYLCDFMQEYWLTGMPRTEDRPLWVMYGSLPGSTAVMVWRQDGINIAAIFNGRNATTNDDVRNAVEAAVTAHLAELQQ